MSKRKAKKIIPIIEVPLLDNEEFKHITNAYDGKIKPGYYISNKGRVFHNSNLLKRSGGIMSNILDGDYYTVRLPTISGKSISCRINKLELQTFQPRDDYTGLVVDHINGDPSDNNLENLRYVSRGGNAKNALDQGKIRLLSDSQIIEAYKMAQKGMTDEEIGKKMGVSEYTVEAIRLKRNYIYKTVLKDYPEIRRRSF